MYSVTQCMILRLHVSGNQVAVFQTGNQVAVFQTVNQVAVFQTGNQVAVFQTGNQVAVFQTENQVTVFQTGNQVAVFHAFIKFRQNFQMSLGVNKRLNEPRHEKTNIMHMRKHMRS